MSWTPSGSVRFGGLILNFRHSLVTCRTQSVWLLGSLSAGAAYASGRMN